MTEPADEPFFGLRRYVRRYEQLWGRLRWIHDAEFLRAAHDRAGHDPGDEDRYGYDGGVMQAAPRGRV